MSGSLLDTTSLNKPSAVICVGQSAKGDECGECGEVGWCNGAGRPCNLCVCLLLFAGRACWFNSIRASGTVDNASKQLETGCFALLYACLCFSESCNAAVQLVAATIPVRLSQPRNIWSSSRCHCD